MDRLRRLAEFWNWLPAFRAVAETSHLPTAARLFLSSPSALSRSVRLLESEVGVPLFERQGRGLRLTVSGERFLAVLRDAMRLLDDGLSAAQSVELEGTFHVSLCEVPFQAVLPALGELRRAYPRLQIEVSTSPSSEVAHLLLRGEIDIAFLTEMVSSRRLKSEVVGRVTSGVYCAREHRHLRAPRVSLREIQQHPFVVQVAVHGGPPRDGWPPSLPRRIGMLVMEAHLLLELCATGDYLAVLSDVAAASPPWDVTLRPLPVAVIPATTVHALYRPALGTVNPAEQLASAVRDHVAKSDTRPGRNAHGKAHGSKGRGEVRGHKGR